MYINYPSLVTVVLLQLQKWRFIKITCSLENDVTGTIRECFLGFSSRGINVVPIWRLPPVYKWRYKHYSRSRGLMVMRSQVLWESNWWGPPLKVFLLSKLSDYSPLSAKWGCKDLPRSRDHLVMVSQPLSESACGFVF